jgi:hypothetical protein
MTGQREYPEWDGRALAELPGKAFTDPADFLIELGKRDDFPDGANEDLVQLFKGSMFRWIRAAEFSAHPEWWAHLTLWLPFFQDERMYGPGDHTRLSAAERWHAAEVAMSVPAQTMPTGSVQLGFTPSAGEPVAIPWHEYCKHYREPPEYVKAGWQPEPVE